MTESQLTWNRSKAPAASPVVYVETNRSSRSTNCVSDTPAAFSVQFNPVPESSALAALGLGVVAFVRKRRKT